MSEVHRWEAVHMKDGDNNIRYQDGTGPDMVKASDYDQLKEELHQYRLTSGGAIAENSTLRKQLDEARRLLDATGCDSATAWDAWQNDVDAWLEANKV